MEYSKPSGIQILSKNSSNTNVLQQYINGCLECSKIADTKKTDSCMLIDLYCFLIHEYNLASIDSLKFEKIIDFFTKNYQITINQKSLIKINIYISK